MDALSVPSALAGLVAAGERIADELLRYTANLTDAPKLARGVVAETTALAHVVARLLPLISPGHAADGPSSTVRGGRRAMVPVAALVLALATGVLALAALEREVDAVVAGGMLDRLQWTVREPAVRGALDALQTLVAVLSAVLSVLSVSVPHSPVFFLVVRAIAMV